MFHLKGNLTLKDLKDYTVIIPSISLVNASQLTLDVLIASKRMERIGHVTDIGFMPVYGPSPFLHCPEEKTASCELYAVPVEKLLAIQFRSIMALKYVGPFHKKLAQVLKEAQVRRIVVLSNGIRFGIEEHYCYMASDLFKETHTQELSGNLWREEVGNDILGGGNDKLLFKAFDQQGIPVMIFYHYISVPTDAIKEEFVLKEINDLLVKFLKIGDNLKLALPISWNTLFEDDPAEMMF